MSQSPSPQWKIDGPAKAAVTVILAHGAGAGMDTPFMEFFAEGLAQGGLRVVRFEFPYMAQRRLGGPKRPPDRADVLRQAWLEVVRQFQGQRLVIGGKSLGGRIASMIADEVQAAGLVCLGYGLGERRVLPQAEKAIIRQAQSGFYTGLKAVDFLKYDGAWPPPAERILPFMHGLIAPSHWSYTEQSHPVELPLRQDDGDLS